MQKISGEARYSIYYAAIFGSIGAFGPFIALWLDHVGVQASMIGIVISAPSLVMLLTTIQMGRLADSLPDRRIAIIGGDWGILFAQIPLLFWLNPWVILISWVVMGIFMYAKVPATDAAALSLTKRNNTDYARIRAWGSVAFVVTVMGAGLVYEKFGISYFLALLLGGSVIRLLLSYQLPKSLKRAQIKTESPVSEGGSLYQTAILLTLVGSSLINASHAMHNTFAILNWTQQGISESLASLAMSVGVIAEVILMWKFRALSVRFSARGCLLFAAACGALRWSILANEPSLPMLFAVQLLHGVTFGMMFLATANFISRRVPEADAARGQSLSATLATAAMAAGTFATGLLYEHWASGVYWLMALICLMGAAALLGSYRFVMAAEPA